MRIALGWPDNERKSLMPGQASPGDLTGSCNSLGDPGMLKQKKKHLFLTT